MASVSPHRPFQVRLSLLWKLVLAVCVPVALAAAVVLARNAPRARDELIAHREQQLRLEAELYAARLDGHLKALEHTARAAAATLTETSESTIEDLFAISRRVVLDDELIYGSCIAFTPERAGPRERLAPYVCREEDGLRQLDIADVYEYTEWEWFAVPVATGRPHWSRAYFDEGAGDILMVTYSVPFYRLGQVAGVLTVDVPLAQLQGTIHVPQFEDRFAILDSEGTFLSCPNPHDILRLNIFDMARRRGRVDAAVDARRIIDSGEAGVIRGISLDGDHAQLTCFAPIGATSWMFVAELPADEIVAPMLAFTREIWIFSLATLVVLILVLMVLSARMVAPIRSLASVAREVGAGRLDARLPALGRRDEIGELSRAFGGMLGDLRNHIDALRRESAAREAVESELRIARLIQESLLPHRFPPFPERPEIDLHAVNAPARHMAGDFYDFFLVDQRTLCVVLADVSGKGVPAAMVMGVARTLVRSIVSAGEPPARVLEQLNASLLIDNDECMFVTMVVGLYDTLTGELRYANGGHPPPRIIRADGSLEEAEMPGGTIVGVLKDASFSEQRLHLAEGDRLVLFSDGVIEARSPAGTMVHAEGLTRWLQSLADADARRLCQEILERLDAFEAGSRHDDVTLLVLGRRPVASARSESGASAADGAANGLSGRSPRIDPLSPRPAAHARRRSPPPPRRALVAGRR